MATLARKMNDLGIMELFDDIRPYHDDEVRPTLNRLLADKDLLNVVAQHSYPTPARRLPGLTTWLTGLLLQRKTRDIDTIRKFQGFVEPYLTRIIKATTSKVTYSGLDQLDKNKSYLFLSNHRDIVLDPALVNYALYQDHRETCRVAIGDNLVHRSFVSDLMRLNKSFLVKRSITGRREKFRAFQALSAYIHHCIETNHPVWIAQSEGRAKDGNDKTDPAIIKMFNVSRRHAEGSFSDNIHKLHIVPVSISYEFDPCARDKARELHQTEQEGSYIKEQDEDMRSIVKGIDGFKGDVHVTFGTPLLQEFEDAESVARAADEQIWHNYQLHPINLFAFEAIASAFAEDYPGLKVPEVETLFTDVDLGQKQKEFMKHLERCRPEYRQWFLKMYAYPVVNKFK